jgi:cobalt-zinc-cadmium resistance protein CzcA
VVTFGGYLKEVHVEVDPSRLLAHGLSLADVSDALGRSNRNVGGGFLQHGDQQLAIRSVGYVRSPLDVQAIVLKSESGSPITVGDVSRVVLLHTPRLGAVGQHEGGAEGFAPGPRREPTAPEGSTKGSGS